MSLERQTGRTTRMLEEATKAAEKGEYVIVASASAEHSHILARTFEGTGLIVGANIEPKVFVGKNGGSISFVPYGQQGVDISRGMVQGAFPSVLLFADHYALESFFRETSPWAWSEWLRMVSDDPA